MHVSRTSALVGSTANAIELVDRYFTKYTRIDLREIAPHNHKFRTLTASSRLEVAFEGIPKGYKIPYYKTYKYDHSKVLVVHFELEVRLIKRYIPPNAE
jgi:hypothetical protein